MAYVWHCDVVEPVVRPNQPSIDDCSQGQWVEFEESSGVLPSLPVDDAAQIAMAIALLWAVAFVWREIRKAINDKPERE